MTQADRVPLVVAVSTAMFDRLHAEAEHAAATEGLTERDISYGFFLSDHIGARLDSAYRAHAEEPAPDMSESGPLTMVAVSLDRTIGE